MSQRTCAGAAVTWGFRFQSSGGRSSTVTWHAVDLSAVRLCIEVKTGALATWPRDNMLLATRMGAFQVLGAGKAARRHRLALQQFLRMGS